MMLLVACIFAQLFRVVSPEEKEAKTFISRYEKITRDQGYKLIASGVRPGTAPLRVYLDWQVAAAGPSYEEAKKSFGSLIQQMREEGKSYDLEISIGWTAPSLSGSSIAQVRYADGWIEYMEEFSQSLEGSSARRFREVCP